MAIERVIVMALIAISLASMVSAIPGTATFYTTYVPSACYGFQDQGIMIAAANAAIYNNGAACGRSYRIRYTGREITVRVVDLCPGCGPDQFDLSQEAFSMIADPDAGRIQIEYNQA